MSLSPAVPRAYAAHRQKRREGPQKGDREGGEQEEERGKRGKRVKKGKRGEKRGQKLQHPDFARGHPPHYYLGQNVLNFADRTGCGALTIVWP